MTDTESTVITSLGNRMFRSPLSRSTVPGDGVGDFTPDEARIRCRAELHTGLEFPDILFEKAGPRQDLFFDPAGTRAAIVTCGGLCPGLNNVIRSAFFELHHNHGVPEVLGIRYGYQGLNPEAAEPPLRLTTKFVEDIHREGGTVLGSSRGAQDIPTMVRFLEEQQINVLLCVGGDGTQRGAHAIATEALRRKLPVAVVGIPKTIDNDILYVQRSFGLATAVEEASKVIDCAHNEARGARNGIGLVKVMGRDSGFIAVGATLASQEVNFALIPEVGFSLDGENGFLNALRRRILDRGHAVVVVAEGAGQDLIPGRDERIDASGNVRHADVGVFLKQQIAEYFATQDTSVSLKYIDPSYIIRSVPANSNDSFLCDQYARGAVHAAMAGKTDLLVGLWNARLIHLPITMAIRSRNFVKQESDLWESVLSTTGQPRRME